MRAFSVDFFGNYAYNIQHEKEQAAAADDLGNDSKRQSADSKNPRKPA